VDVTDQTFQDEVLALSATTPVVVDLWAPWCGPCKTLGPILEKVVAGTEGRVALAKVNVDENPRISSTFDVKSIPAVFAIANGQVVDQFIGALPEAQVAEFVQRLSPPPSEADQLVVQGDEASLRRALELQPNHPAARAALVRLESADDPVLGPALAALAEGETERGLELLLQALQDAGADLRERIRQLMVGVFAELGQDDPLASRYRRRLASALY
jgi:putative thioredoxin